MQQSALSDPVTIENQDVKHDSTASYLDGINFYRTAPLSASQNDWENLQTITHFVALQRFADARLHQEMHPLPLAQVNDSKKLSDDIINNCSLATQKRLKQTYNNTIIEDNTLMSDIIEQSESFWAA